ncbi:NADH-ubiquinone oxidoreductase-F iron-sulfur binding region domain-containing protein [Halorarius litoreus]|uniref:NADH-ubiquinone oxidoreductase-F iron-sulfur binding region domain-containing protein n=1 Tax=Halorarius litoreus TaxID=2962676 RepID=UPI0020CD0920|nr:NADH-ubiquinone oxidoreductase-F iron-sulfur binding region domain-containing protein [Halorarius litoreus]
MTHHATLRTTVAPSTDTPAVPPSHDAVDVRVVGSAGLTHLEPLAFATLDGRTAIHTNVTTEALDSLCDRLEAGTLPTDGAHATVAHDPTEPPQPSGGPLSAGTRRVLARCGWADPTDPSPLDGGLHTNGARVVEAVRDAGLRPRGRGDAAHAVGPERTVAEEWDAARETPGDPVVIVNATESDPGIDGDRLLLEADPATVLDGALVAAGAVGADEIVVAVSEADELARARTEALVAAATERDLVETSLEVVTAPDAFLVTEPTMMLESLEGADRIEARRRPPGPAEYGLFGRPTVIHTPRTLAQVAVLGRAGTVGAPSDPGTRLMTVTHGEKRATVEIPTDAPLRDALRGVGSPWFKMACVGGQFGGLTRTLATPANADAMHGARLGTEGAIELLDDGRCAVALAGRRAKFAREENCGRCVPCREGSKQLHELLRDVYDGEFDDGDVRELARTVRDTSLCGFGTAAARPVLTALDEFGPEFAAHANGRCPAGECR